MNIKLYKQICRNCDDILNSKDATENTVAISSLHVLKEHPVLLEQYLGNNQKLNLYKNDSFFFKIFNFFINFFKEKKNYIISKNLKKKCDVLIISNLINKKFIENKDDFYFGNLEKILNSSGLKTLIALRNFTEIRSDEFKKKIDNKKIIFTHRTDFFFEIKLIFKIIAEFFNVKKISNKHFKNKNFNIKHLISLRTIAYNLRFGNQVRNLLMNVKPKILIIPFEGHAWERIVIKSSKEVHNNIKVAAYQFSSITKYQHSLFRPLKKEYNPDIIFTSGKITKKIFKNKYDCLVKILGSKKYLENKIKKSKYNNNFFINFIPLG